MAEIVSKYPNRNKQRIRKTYFELLNFMKAHVTSNNSFKS